MSKRILLLTQWFDPEPTFKGLVFARELVKLGFDVEVVTGFPNYPGGRIYPGYRVQLLQRETIDGVQVTRVPLYPSHDQSSVKRALNYISFAFSSLIYCLFLAKRADVIYAYHPPLTVGLTASIVRIFRRTPVVYDVQDMWPDTLKATGMINNTKVLKLISMICSWVYKRADKIVVLSPGFKQLLTERNVDKDKISVIYNWADEESINCASLALPDNFPTDERFKALFAGNMGMAQSLDTVLDAAAILFAQKASVCFLMLGGGVEVERLKTRAAALMLDNIVFLPAVTMQNVGGYLSNADVLLVHLRADPLFKITIPSKTQAYMAAGRPILMAVDGDAADLITAANCGYISASDNPQELADVTVKMSQLSKSELQKFGENASKFYKEQLSVAVGAKQFADIFNSI